MIETKSYRGPDRRQHSGDTYPRLDLDPVATAAERMWPHLDNKIRDTIIKALTETLDARMSRAAERFTDMFGVDPRTPEGQQQLAKAAKLVLVVSGAYCEGCSTVRQFIGRLFVAWMTVAAGAAAVYFSGALQHANEWLKRKIGM